MAELWFDEAEAWLVARQSVAGRASGDTQEDVIMEQEGQNILKEKNRRPEAGQTPVENF